MNRSKVHDKIGAFSNYDTRLYYFSISRGKDKGRSKSIFVWEAPRVLLLAKNEETDGTSI